MLPHRRLAILSGLRPIRQVPWVSGSVLVGSVAANEIVHGVIIVDRFAGIPPEALEDVELRDALGDEPVVDVRDLELPPARWLEPGQHLEDLAGIKVDARHPKLAGRLLWLFDDLDNAILAVEDARFYDHVGIDPIRIVGAGWKTLTSNKVEGGSTLTQQLAKNLFLTREQTLTRKVNEWVLALQIERYYTKNQIMELYANHIFVGANSYGVEAGAETYFGKQAKDLTLDEAALRDRFAVALPAVGRAVALPEASS